MSSELNPIAITFVPNETRNDTIERVIQAVLAGSSCPRERGELFFGKPVRVSPDTWLQECRDRGISSGEAQNSFEQYHTRHKELLIGELLNTSPCHGDRRLASHRFNQMKEAGDLRDLQILPHTNSYNSQTSSPRNEQIARGQRYQPLPTPVVPDLQDVQILPRMVNDVRRQRYHPLRERANLRAGGWEDVTDLTQRGSNGVLGVNGASPARYFDGQSGTFNRNASRRLLLASAVTDSDPAAITTPFNGISRILHAGGRDSNSSPEQHWYTVECP